MGVSFNFHSNPLSLFLRNLTEQIVKLLLWRCKSLFQELLNFVDVCLDFPIKSQEWGMSPRCQVVQISWLSAKRKRNFIASMILYCLIGIHSVL